MPDGGGTEHSRLSDEELLGMIAFRDEKSSRSVSDAWLALFELQQRHGYRVEKWLYEFHFPQATVERLFDIVWDKVFRYLPRDYIPGKFPGWLKTITKHRAMDEPDPPLPAPPPPGLQPLELLLVAEERQRLKDCLEKLKTERPDWHAVFTGRFSNDPASYEKIGKELGIERTNTLHKYFSFAKDWLGKCVKGDGHP